MKNALFFFICMAANFSNPFFAESCTGLRLTAKDGGVVHGRTFEFELKVETSVIVVPRDYSFTSMTPNGEGLAYRAKYAAIGTACFDEMVIMDGMNEKGLSIGTFYFPGYAGYADTTVENQENSLSPIDFPNWIITQFSSLEEIKKNLPNVAIAPTIIRQWGRTPPPFHYLVYDKNGESIVIEPVNGKLLVYDNPLGILTNSPDFEWHMTNLRNFLNLSPKGVLPLKIKNLVLVPFGLGSGMVGMPGDFTPPSRFVRAAIYSITATLPAHTEEAVFQTFHILNQFDIPLGVSREIVNSQIYSDYTLATVVHDPNNLKYYFRTYEDQTIKCADLNAFDKTASELKKTSTSGKQTYVNISNELKPTGSKLR